MNSYSKMMTVLALFVLSLQACQNIAEKSTISESSLANQQEKGVFTFSGKISNNTKDSMKLFTYDRDEKIVKINADGTFSDTLKITEPGVLFINYDKAQYRIFARNGYDVFIAWDAKKDRSDVTKTMQFSGYGSDVMSYFRDDYYAGSSFEEKDYELEREELKKKVLFNGYQRVKRAPQWDTAFIQYYLRSNVDTEYRLKMYDKANYIKTKLAKGTPSPKFLNFESHDGSKVSLDDFKGKYVYIDIWATWCKPCIAEFPYLKKLEKKYHNNEKVVFLSLSVDSLDNKELWKEMIDDEELGGVHLISDNTTESDFFKAYKVGGIPHFILLDPQGNIIDPKAPRPSRLINSELPIDL